MNLNTNKTNNICCVFFEKQHFEYRDVSGFFGKYKFCATIYDQKNNYGIDGDPVIALTVWRISKTVKRISKTINYIRETETMKYNRGWIVNPQGKKESMALSVILFCLKRLPR